MLIKTPFADVVISREIAKSKNLWRMRVTIFVSRVRHAQKKAGRV
jgi:hypothetical protein